VTQTGLTVFAAIGLAGLAGSVAARRLADRIGRTATTSGAIILSAACCLASPLAFASSRGVLIGMLAIWGAAVIADSAQFSAAVTELAEPCYTGSILALPTRAGLSP
jgi:predicted MFS family arabinose efflux permease